MALTNAALLKAISEDRALASSMMFPHRHPQASPAFHVEVMDLWRSVDEFAMIEAFREGAKSTLSEEFLLLEAAFGNFGYCLIIGETYTKACQRLEAIKFEASRNMKLQSLFGRLKAAGRLWNEHQIELPNGVLLEAHGWEEELRGFKWHDLRPDRAYLDDIENKERVKDAAAVNASMNKLYLELMPAMDKVKGKIRFTQTPLAEDCLVTRLRDNPDWTTRRFPICNGDIDDPATESLWPDRYPMEWIRKKRDEMERAGQLRGFMQEYMLEAIGTQDKPFEEDHIRECALDPAPWLPKVVITDPARTTDVKKSDRTGRVVVSRLGTRIFVHDSSGEYWKPDEIIDDAFKSSGRHGNASVAIEKNSLDEWLLQPMRAEMLRRGTTLVLRALSAPQDRDKVQFIMGLQPFFQAGDIVLVGGRGAHPKLVSEILNFPSGKRDILNALAYVQRVFAGIPVYEDFGEWNLTSEYEPTQQNPLALAFNASGTETTAALVCIEGQRAVIVADWVSPVPPKDAVPDIAQLVRAAFPRARITAWLPADVVDQSDRMPIVPALRAANMHPMRGAYINISRGALSPLIRTEAKGRRLLLVDRDGATHTLNAMAGGYVFPMDRSGNKGSLPETGPHRTLIEGLEAAIQVIGSQRADVLPEGVNMGTNPQGVSYLTTLPRR
ncbi:hypothetical protein C7399_109199 [Paraburkholderia tropica]|uniref:Uncharacterized protein n=1 Tax=Paraburkholderia tropica TaxID=92647 RepID=A0ABX5MNQ0_9BURK|nr:hypothetical protein [Paraburkholderia tropica]PXX15864.1 hypothetical protein C7400_109199 [Paraburkholderia tropica]PZW82123.1 hypothetical protein C7399_109199 [Paraburkholderia tropica]